MCENKECILKMSELIINSCSCYKDYWRILRESYNRNNNNDIITFDESIKKVKSFRMHFGEEKEIFHFCINCIRKLFFTIPKSTLEFNQSRFKGGCILKTVNGEQPIEEACSGCIIFSLANFSAGFFKKI